jgi:hypothetical protein
MRRRQVLAGLAALPYASARPAQAATRRFRMGTTRWPPDLSLRAFGQVELFLRDQADMAAPMVLGGVPWQAALDETPFSNALMSELTWHAPQGHPVLLSLGALDTMRRSMAPLYAVKDNQPLPPDWAARDFDDPAVIRAYSAFCLRAVEAMRPTWLAIGVEVNLLNHFAPDRWPAYLRLHRAAVKAVKTRHPDLPILATIAAQHFMGMADGTDPGVQAQAMAELADHTDMFGFSIYTHLSTDVPDPIPPGFYDPLLEFAARLGKPSAITESGTASAPIPWGWTSIPGSPERQVQATEALFQTASDGDMAFVVNWTSHDYPAFLEKIPEEARDLASLWVSTGILDGDGTDKAVTPLWRDWLARTPG